MVDIETRIIAIFDGRWRGDGLYQMPTARMQYHFWFTFLRSIQIYPGFPLRCSAVDPLVSTKEKKAKCFAIYLCIGIAEMLLPARRKLEPKFGAPPPHRSQKHISFKSCVCEHLKNVYAAAAAFSSSNKSFSGLEVGR